MISLVRSHELLFASPLIAVEELHYRDGSDPVFALICCPLSSCVDGDEPKQIIVLQEQLGNKTQPLNLDMIFWWMTAVQ